MDDLDVEALRGTLDRLTVAIQKPTIGVARWVPLGDRSRLAASLREITRLFDATDLETKRALIGVAPRRTAHARSTELRASLDRVSVLLTQYFSSAFSEGDLARLKLLLEFPAPDFLHALGRATDENSHSDVIAYLLDPRTAPGTAPGALARLAQILPESERWAAAFAQSIDRDELCVRREVRTGRFWDEDPNALDRVDLVISGRGFILAIENKVWSREHDRQTDTYWDWLQAMPGRKAGIFLSPGGFRAQSEHFVPLSYRKMAWCFLGEAPARSPEEEVMLSGYFKAVFGRVLRNNAEMILGGST